MPTLEALIIFIGAGIGGLLRFWVSNLSHALFGRVFPYGTLVVNVTGSFLMGMLFWYFLEKFKVEHVLTRAFLMVGFCGGYTTFSAFSIETFYLFENGQLAIGLLNILLSVLLCLLATWAGFSLGKLFFIA